MDPCAGEGTAITTLRELWTPSTVDDPEIPWYKRPARPTIEACELEEDRASQLRGRLESNDSVYIGDAFRLVPQTDPSSGLTVLYLNPPYDHDSEFRRLEHRFLARFTSYLYPGAGILFFLVPYHALSASAEFLASHYLDIRAWRLPEKHFDVFGQALLVARRAARPMAAASMASTIEGWAKKPESMPVLPRTCPDPFTVLGDVEYRAWFQMAEHDFGAALGSFRPWEGTPTGVDQGARELMGARFLTAVPPKPAHIALALSTGIFNGRTLTPNDPKHPRVIAKGTFRRKLVEIGERKNAEGELTGTVNVETPALELTILRLDTYRFHHLAAGTVPTGSDKPEEWNSADLIANYDRSLARELDRQFPAIHDPLDEAGQIRLPELARVPFGAQSNAIQAALKLLARGLNPFIVAEVGTGKSTIGLFIAASLAPRHRAATLAELDRVGEVQVKLPTVRRTLIVMPPHLLKSWTDQVAAVVPSWKVQVIRKEADLRAEADVYLLSRETAKLGHGFEGLERCPRCGEVSETSAKSNASRRLRCKAKRRGRPLNIAARLAEDLATALAPTIPDHPLVHEIQPGVLARAWFRREEFESKPIRLGPCRSVAERLLGAVERLYAEVARKRPGNFQLGSLLRVAAPVAQALGTAPETADRLREIAASHPVIHRIKPTLDGVLFALDNPPDVAPLPNLLKALEKLHDLGRWEDPEPCGEPLFQAVPKPRRYPLARLIQRRFKNFFDLLLIDEAHEYNQTASAQTKAAHRLMSLPGVPSVLLTGSLMGGYASSLFASFWALSPLFREDFDRKEKIRFIDQYGYRKVFIKARQARDGRRGARTDRELDTANVGEAPGILPTFILRHLLPTSVLLHKEDLALELPSLTETPTAIDFEGDRATELYREYSRIQAILLHQIGADRFTPNANKLLGALVEMPSYLDRCTNDLAPFEIRYPESAGGGLIAEAKAFPSHWRTPKERWLLRALREHLDLGERVAVFLRHTGTSALPRRILELIKGSVTGQAVWLDTKKVPTAKREAWIDEQVLAKDVKVLLVNPNAVRTGLNNLVAFSVGIWYELDYSATTYRQANGRFHRIGQKRDVTIEMPYYAQTAQEIAFDLVARKISASLQVDGLDLQAALEAAGASDERAASMATAMSLGQAVYERLTAAA